MANGHNDIHKYRLQDFGTFLTPSPLRLHSNSDIISKYISAPFPPYFCRRHLWMPPYPTTQKVMSGSFPDNVLTRIDWAIQMKKPISLKNIRSTRISGVIHRT